MTGPSAKVIAAWKTIEEPRSVTTLAIISYAIVALMGGLFAMDPIHAAMDVSTPWLLGFTVLLLVSGGAVGVPAAWRGAWWLERGATVAVGGGVVLLAGNVLALNARVWPLVVVFLSLSLAFLGTRYIRVRRAPFAPGKGPMLPAQEALLEEATRREE